MGGRGRGRSSLALAQKPTFKTRRPAADGHCEIAEALNIRGVSTPRGGQWYATSVRNVLARASAWGFQETPRSFVGFGGLRPRIVGTLTRWVLFPGDLKNSE